MSAMQTREPSVPTSLPIVAVQLEAWLQSAQNNLKSIKEARKLVSVSNDGADLVEERLALLLGVINHLSDVASTILQQPDCDTTAVSTMRSNSISMYNECRNLGHDGMPVAQRQLVMRVRHGSCQLLDIISKRHTAQATILVLRCWHRIAIGWEALSDEASAMTAYRNCLACLEFVGGPDRVPSHVFGMELESVCQSAFEVCIRYATLIMNTGSKDVLSVYRQASLLDTILAQHSAAPSLANRITLTQAVMKAVQGLMSASNWASGISWIGEALSCIPFDTESAAPEGATLARMRDHLILSKAYCTLELLCSGTKAKQFSSAPTKELEDLLSTVHSFLIKDDCPPVAIYLLCRAQAHIGHIDEAHAAVKRLIAIAETIPSTAADDLFPVVLSACACYADATQLCDDSLVAYSQAAAHFRHHDHACSLRVDLMTRLVVHESDASTATPRVLKFMGRTIEDHRTGRLRLARPEHAKQLYHLARHSFFETFLRNKYESCVEWGYHVLELFQLFPRIFDPTSAEVVRATLVAALMHTDRRADAHKEVFILAESATTLPMMQFCLQMLLTDFEKGVNDGRVTSVDAASSLCAEESRAVQCIVHVCSQLIGCSDVKHETLTDILHDLVRILASHRLEGLARVAAELVAFGLQMECRNLVILDGVAACRVLDSLSVLCDYAEVCNFVVVGAQLAELPALDSIAEHYTSLFCGISQSLPSTMSSDSMNACTKLLQETSQYMVSIAAFLQLHSTQNLASRFWHIAALTHTVLATATNGTVVRLKELWAAGTCQLLSTSCVLSACCDSTIRDRVHSQTNFVLQHVKTLASFAPAAARGEEQVPDGAQGVVRSLHSILNGCFPDLPIAYRSMPHLLSALSATHIFIDVAWEHHPDIPMDSSLIFSKAIGATLQSNHLAWLVDQLNALGQTKFTSVAHGLMVAVLDATLDGVMPADGTSFRVAAAFARRLLTSAASRIETTGILEKMRTLLQANLLAAGQASLHPGQLIPPSELDFAICIAWNHGIFCLRAGWIDQSLRFFGWCTSMLPALSSLRQCHLACSSPEADAFLVSFDRQATLIAQYQAVLEMAKSPASQYPSHKVDIIKRLLSSTPQCAASD